MVPVTEKADDVLARIKAATDRAGVEIPAWVLEQLAAEKASRSADAPTSLLKYIGCLNSGNHHGSDNELIDEELAREYGNEVE
jgi:hypothetical protein